MPKILIIDDDDDLRKIFARYLVSEGFEVLEARSGEQALSEFREENLDVILLDIRMPVANGHELMPRLQHLHPKAKIIISSCYEHMLQKKMIENAEDYFNKSDGCQALLSKVTAVLSQNDDSNGKANTQWKIVDHS